MGVSRLRWHRRDGPPKENVGRCGGRSHKEGGESAAAPAGVFQHPEDPERSRKFPEWVCPYVAYSFASFPCIPLLLLSITVPGRLKKWIQGAIHGPSKGPAGPIETPKRVCPYVAYSFAVFGGHPEAVGVVQARRLLKDQKPQSWETTAFPLFLVPFGVHSTDAHAPRAFS